MTTEQKKAIFEEYSNRENSVRSVADKYGISRAEVTRIAVEQGATPRRPNAYGKKGGAICRTCPKCKKRIDIKGARFCYFCGADIRSARDILIEKVEKTMQCIAFLPQNTRDEVRDVLVEVIKELKK